MIAAKHDVTVTEAVGLMSDVRASGLSECDAALPPEDEGCAKPCLACLFLWQQSIFQLESAAQL